MEILLANLVNTTTQIVVDSNTDTVANILNRDVRFQYASVGYNDDNTSTILTIQFDQTETVDRIGLLGHNLKDFRIFYDGFTNQTLNLTSTADTTVTNYISNSDTSKYFVFTPINCTSLSIQMNGTILSDSNKAIGYLVVSENLTSFQGRIPSAQQYSTSIIPTQVVHKLSDGGKRIQTLDDKHSSKVAFDFISQTIRDELKEIYDEHEEIIFVPFGTATSWDTIIYPCVWEGAFSFFKYSDNASEAGFSGSLTFSETPV